jgi:hypothetical protein
MRLFVCCADARHGAGRWRGGGEPGHEQSSGLFVPGERLGACAQRGLQCQGFGRRAVTRASSTDSPHLFERNERSECSELCGATDTRAPQRSQRAFGADRRSGVPAHTCPRLGSSQSVNQADIQKQQRPANQQRTAVSASLRATTQPFTAPRHPRCGTPRPACCAPGRLRRSCR